MGTPCGIVCSLFFFKFFWNSGYRKKKQFTDGNKLMYLENYIPE